jgi:nucleoside-diphosphate-sugar epimerase
MDKILITGASGFIGNNLINYLQSKSFNILAFSREFGMDYKKIDSNYIDDEDIDVVIHLAGKAHDLKNIINEQEYFKVNTDLTIALFGAFLKSNAKTFLYFSSVKAVKDHFNNILTEDINPSPTSAYGKSKLAAENYLSLYSNQIEKRIYILRPCMIHGGGNKGNLNLLYNLISKNILWPLGAFNNERSFCNIDNLCFVVNELISRPEIPTGIYNIADDESISTNEIIDLIAKSQNRKAHIVSINKNFIKFLANLGNYFKLPLNTERLSKLTESYIVSNSKIKIAIGKKLPLSTKEGLLKTFYAFNK